MITLDFPEKESTILSETGKSWNSYRLLTTNLIEAGRWLIQNLLHLYISINLYPPSINSFLASYRVFLGPLIRSWRGKNTIRR